MVYPFNYFPKFLKFYPLPSVRLRSRSRSSRSSKSRRSGVSREEEASVITIASWRSLQSHQFTVKIPVPRQMTSLVDNRPERVKFIVTEARIVVLINRLCIRRRFNSTNSIQISKKCIYTVPNSVIRTLAFLPYLYAFYALP